MMLILLPLKSVFHVMVATKSDVHVNVMMLTIMDNIISCLRSEWLSNFALPSPAPEALITDWLLWRDSCRGRNDNKVNKLE
jgi:hypothetical protein